MTTTAAERTLRDLDALSRAGATFEDFALQASAAMRRAVPFEAFCMGLADPATNMLRTSVKVGLSDVADRDFLYWEYGEDDFGHFADIARRPVGVSILEDETDGDKFRSGRYREVTTVQIGAEHELRAVTRVGGLMWGSYALYREPGRSPFNAAEADFLQRLEAVIATGIRASTIVSVAAAALPEATGPAVLVFSGDGSLQHSTATAAERLDDLGGRLEEVLPVAVQVLVATVRGKGVAAPTIDGRPAALGAAQIRARGRSGVWYALHAAPFQAGGPTPAIAVTIEQATPPQILPLLTAAYGLTDREATIVQAMLRGESTHAIAQQLFLSPYTVQDHFKSIFDKIGVSSRREVATRVFYGQYLTTM